MPPTSQVLIYRCHPLHKSWRYTVTAYVKTLEDDRHRTDAVLGTLSNGNVSTFKPADPRRAGVGFSYFFGNIVSHRR